MHTWYLGGGGGEGGSVPFSESTTHFTPKYRPFSPKSFSELSKSVSTSRTDNQQGKLSTRQAKTVAISGKHKNSAGFDDNKYFHERTAEQTICVLFVRSFHKCGLTNIIESFC